MGKVLLSLHGFHSSPESLKARQLAEYIKEHHPEITFLCPQLPCTPDKMWQLIESIFEKYSGDTIGVVGSSLGGYLATKVVEVYKNRAVLVNPAVTPYRLMQTYAGQQVHPYLGEKYQIDNYYMDQLKALDVQDISNPENCWVLIQEEDEVLDYQQALTKYQGCKITCEAGGDHSFIGFDRFIPDIIHFFFKF
jgi:predicted esterase YcpF (UPF0227 family)